jgi:hypothetical protein
LSFGGLESVGVVLVYGYSELQEFSSSSLSMSGRAITVLTFC